MRSRALVAALTLCALGVTACAPPPSPAPPTVSAPVPAVAPKTRVLAATSGDYPPLSVARGDRYEGFAPALVATFAVSRSMDVAWSRFRWTELAEGMRAGRFELAADGITVRPERSIAGRFTVPIARGGAVLLLRRPAWAHGTARADLDRRELRIAVNRGAHLERVTRELFPAADLHAIADNGEVRAAFARGDVDAAMTNTFEAPRWAAGLAGVEQVGPLTNDVTALWVRADREDLATALDDFLLDEEASGRLASLRAKELGPGAGPAAALVPSALFAAIAERLSLMPFVAAAKERAGLPVEDAAQEGRVLAAARAEVAKAARAVGRAAPPDTAVDAVFRAQIDLAKALQAKDPRRGSADARGAD